MKKRKITAVDLFCGAGGLTRGLLDAGVSVQLGIDLDPACCHPFEANNPGTKYLLADVAELDAAVIKKTWRKKDIKLLAGCAPCQPFSTYNQGRDERADGQWSLLKAFGRLVEECQPDIVTMENVGSLARHGIFRQFCRTLKANEFDVVWSVLDCRDFGVPQARRRLVLIGSRLGRPKLPRPTVAVNSQWLTVRDSISHLPPIKAGESHPEDPIHVSSRLTPVNLKRIQASKPGGTWRDWPKKLIAPCHKRDTGHSYPAVYGRMEWDAPAPTMTGQCYGFGNGRFGHPVQDRGISLREAAMLQTFPRDYSFVPQGDPVQMTNVGQMIGNAVPPKLAEAVGLAINEHVGASSG